MNKKVALLTLLLGLSTSAIAAHNVKINGSLNGDMIKVDSGCIPGPTGCQ